MRRTASDLKIRLSRSEKTSSPFVLVSISPTVTGPVFWQAIDEFDGSTNQFPLKSLSIRPRLNRPIWQLTPCTFGSATASTTIGLPVQSFLKRPTSSAEGREITARRARQLIIGWCIGNIYQLHGDYSLIWLNVTFLAPGRHRPSWIVWRDGDALRPARNRRAAQLPRII